MTIEQIREVLRESVPYIQSTFDEAEIKHDNSDDFNYESYTTMVQTEDLMKRIKTILNDLD